MYKLFLTSVFSLLLLYAGNAGAYLCWSSKDVRDIAVDADVVFTGRVILIEDLGKSKTELGSNRKRISFLTESVWKGLDKNQTDVYVDTESVYEYDFKIGGTYLVFGYHLYGNRISIIGCPRTKKISEVSDDIRKLGDPEFVLVKSEYNDAINVVNGSAKVLDTVKEDVVEDIDIENLDLDSLGVEDDTSEKVENNAPEKSEKEIKTIVEDLGVPEEFAQKVKQTEETKKSSEESDLETIDVVWEYKGEDNVKAAIDIPPLPPEGWPDNIEKGNEDKQNTSVSQPEQKTPKEDGKISDITDSESLSIIWENVGDDDKDTSDDTTLQDTQEKLK